ncbi:hypothetical protein BRD17_03805 [Halobacteriales archaeon SW_7_68_16]|nr:MAG: hypothetical protein BRD17_03805 [Halobacteriales archaeon SW_7_68_16]
MDARASTHLSVSVFLGPWYRMTIHDGTRKDYDLVDEGTCVTGEADGVDGRTVGNPRLLAVAVTVLLALAAVGTAGAALPAATETAVATDDGPRVTNYVVSSDTLATGEEIVVTATVTNPTRNPVELPVRLRINGSVVETRSVTVGERTRRQVRFVHRVTSGFDRRVTIGDQPPTTVAVEGDLPEVEVTLRQHLAGGAQVVVDSDEPLSALRVRLEHIGGETSVTYGDGTFERENGTPVARLLGVPEGDLRVTVTRAVDEDGDDGASGQSDTARITQGTRDTDPPQAIGYSAEADGQTVRVRAPATEPIDEFGIEVRTDGRTRVGWFDGTDVTLRDGAYVGEKQFDYRGDAEVVLQRLTDHAGNDGASGEVERVTLRTPSTRVSRRPGSPGSTRTVDRVPRSGR